MVNKILFQDVWLDRGVGRNSCFLNFTLLCGFRLIRRKLATWGKTIKLKPD